MTAALLAVVAGLLVPFLGRSFASHRLRTAGEQVRSELGRARVAAMTAGRTMAFRFAIEGAQYSVAPLDTGEPTEAAAFGGAYFAGTTGGETTWTAPRRGTLPEEVVFHVDPAAMATVVAYETVGASAPTGGAEAEFGWSLPILFHPDGTTSTAELHLRNDREQVVEIRLRGLTGVVTVSDVMAMEELVP